jgi:Circadian oscillating protein COP23
MHKILASVISIGCLVGMVSLLPSPVKAEKKPPITRFYCGQSFDPSSKEIVPTTIVATSANKEPISLIMWKSTAFGDEYTPQTRCQNVSGKLQQAWDAKRFKYLTSGTFKSTGQGIICAVADKKAKCDRSSMLFTLTSGSNAKDIINRIKGVTSGKASNPLAQSSADDAVDMQEILE